MGLANRLVEPGGALDRRDRAGRQIAAFPQRCLRCDRASSYDQWALDLDDALAPRPNSVSTIRSGETLEGATRFAARRGPPRHPA